MSEPAWGTVLRVGFDSLRASPLRTGLSTLGVIIGVASLVAILSLGDGLERYSRDQISGTTDLLLISVDPITTDRADGIIIIRRDIPRLTVADVGDLARELPGSEVTAILQAGGWVSSAGDTARMPALINATLPATSGFLPQDLQQGRFLTDDDVTRDERVVVVSANLAPRLGLEPADLPGRSLDVDGAAYRVIGIFDSGSDEPIRILAPLTPTAEARWSRVDRVPGMLVRAGRVEDVDDVRARVEAWLDTRYGDATGRFRVGSNRARVAQARQGILLFKLAMGSIAGISLLVGGIGIMNIMLASVVERTREIGIRKAAGARGRDILLQFLWESVAITFAGAAVGVVLGLVGAFAITAALRELAAVELHAGFSWSTVLTAVLTAVSVGLAFGTYPARRAARLAPIDAIRYE
jgi:putative ABC transport system permease protein